MDGDIVIAAAHVSDFQLPVPSPPIYEEAVKTSQSYIGFHDEYLYPECFGCGRNRPAGEGLRIFQGRLRDSNLLAAPWIPVEWHGNDAGQVKSEFVWAALDCPGGIASMGDEFQPLLLGRLAVQIEQRPLVDQPCIVVGWEIAQEGREHFAGTALFSEDGRLLAYGRAIWILPRQA